MIVRSLGIALLSAPMLGCGGPRAREPEGAVTIAVPSDGPGTAADIRFPDPPRGGAPVRSKLDASEARAAAQTAFEAGRAALNVGNVAEACGKFRESLGYDRALGTLLNLAVCEERLGNLPSACGLFRDAAEEAKKTHDSRAQMADAKRTALNCPP